MALNRTGLERSCNYSWPYTKNRPAVPRERNRSHSPSIQPLRGGVLGFGNRSNEGSCWLGAMSGDIVPVNLRMIVMVESSSGAGSESDDAE